MDLRTSEDPPSAGQTFRFAGVELGPNDVPEDKIRAAAKVSLLKHSAIAVIVGAGLALGILCGEVALSDPSVAFLQPLPHPYPFLTYGLPLFILWFYIGWALYWGAFDSLNADAMDEPHGLNRFLGRFVGGADSTLSSRIAFLLGPSGIGLVYYAVWVLVFCAIVVYSLLGGGILGFYGSVRRASSIRTGSEIAL
jgi:hypothetical protein